MINVTVERENGRTKLILSPQHRIDAKTQAILKAHRFHNAYTDKYWEWRGPDTDKAENIANEIAENYNSKQK